MVILSATLSYSIYEKRKIEILSQEAESPILQKLPDFQLDNFYTKDLIEREKYLAKYKLGVFVHFWGTWCGPCEAELPDFISFAKKFKETDVGFLLVAVNDDDKKIKKFMKRFSKLPNHMIIVHDRTGKMMSKFGTVKVPETFLFNQKGKHLNKYTGPQNWDSAGFYKIATKFLSP